MDWLIAAGEVALRRWRGDFALRLYREAGETAERIGDSRAADGYARAVEIGTRMSGISGNPDADQLRPLLERGHALVTDDDTVTKARLLLDEAWIAWKNDQTLEMELPALEGLELAREAGDPTVLQAALDAVTASDWQQGRHRAAVEHTRERLDLLGDAPRTGTLDVERSDALHMMIECLRQTGDFHEAERYASEARDLDLSRGIIYSAWQRGLLPAFFLGRWDEALDMATHVREAWIAAERPPLGAFATSIACAGVCLTVVDIGEKGERTRFAVDAAAETLRLTTVGRWREGTKINLERALKVGDELGGHIVAGHADGLATLTARARARRPTKRLCPRARHSGLAPAAAKESARRRGHAGP